MSWKSVDLNEIVPSEIATIADTGLGLIDQYLDFARLAVTIAKGFQAGLGGAPDILGAAVRLLVDTLEGFLQLGKVHILFIPMTKMFPRDTGILGGNDRFYSVFSSTLNDVFDSNRPQYADTDAVVMTTILAGAPSYAEAMNVAAAFNRIFRPPSNVDLTSNTVPTPQNVRARPVAHPAAGRIAVRLDWDVPNQLFTFPYFPGIGFTVRRRAIIRSTSATVLNARSVVDLFQTRALTEGMTSSDSAKHHKVVNIGTGANSSYVDQDKSLDPNQTYYYTVAWELNLRERGKNTLVQFDLLSNVVKTRVRTSVTSENAVPPNWSSLPSLIQLIPALADSVFLLSQQLKTVGDKSSGHSGGASKALQLIESRIERVVQEMDTINASFKRLTAILKQPIPTIHGITFSGVGGNAFLQTQLLAALNDKNDINRPAFDGNEYVLGVCIVAGGPRIADIQPIVDFLGLMFGDSGAANPLAGVLDVLDAAVTDVETIVFGENLEALPSNATEGIDPLTGLPTVVTGDVIGTDGTPLGTADPANPQAGETNVTPLGELC